MIRPPWRKSNRRARAILHGAGMAHGAANRMAAGG